MGAGGGGGSGGAGGRGRRGRQRRGHRRRRWQWRRAAAARAAERGGSGSGTGGSSPSTDASPMGGDTAGYDVKPDMMEDMGMAREALGGDEFIFDVQTHVVPPETTYPSNQILDYLR